MLTGTCEGSEAAGCEKMCSSAAAPGLSAAVAGARAWGKAGLRTGSLGRNELPTLPWWIWLLCGGEREPSAL